MGPASSLILLTLVLLAHGPPRRQGRPPRHRSRGACCEHCERKVEEDKARDAAMEATGGKAVALRRVTLNGTWGGCEVLVHMPGGKTGWRVVVDLYPVRVRDRYVIPNPPDRR